MTKNVAAKTWILPATGDRRYSAGPPDPVGPWADVFITDIADIGPELAADGVTVGITVGSSFTGLGQQLTSGNGATMDIVTGGSFDGEENAVRIYPPTTLVSGEGQYASWLRNINLWSSGSTNIAQINFRWLHYYGTTYFSHAAPTKVTGFWCQDSLSSPGVPRRQGLWETQDTVNWTPYKYMGTTSNSVQYYPGAFIDSVPDSSKLMRIGGSQISSNSPPQFGGSWVCYEMAVDLRQNRGNAFGMNKIVCWTRDGVVSARSIQSPCNWDPPWSFTYQYIETFEGLGFYWNVVGTANANNYLMHSHATFAANMAYDALIGPPPGFLL